MPREVDPYVRVRDDIVVISVPVQDRVGRGLWLAFGIPPLVVLVVWGIAAFVEPEGIALAVVSIAAALLAGLPGLAGMILVGTAARRAQKERVKIDIGERLIEFFNEEPEVFHDPTEVRITKTRGFPGGWSLSIVDDEGVDEILRSIPRTRGRALGRAADHLAKILEVPATVPNSARKAPLLVPERSATWAALCYAPVPIVAEAYAFWALATSQKSGIRFVAKQSLLQLAVESIFGFAILSCIGAPLGLMSGALPFAFTFGALACPLTLLFAIRTSVRIYAGLRSLRRELFVLPWLAPISRRWLPPEFAPQKGGPRVAVARRAPVVAPTMPKPPEGWSSPPSSVPESKEGRSTKLGDPFR